jgi:hypothetical protein
MTDKERLDFLDLMLSAGLSLGIKPGFRAIVGTVYLEGATSIRDLIDKMKRINDEDEKIDTGRD